MSVWNSVYFISSNNSDEQGEYSWFVEIMVKDRVLRSYNILADHIDDAKRKVRKDLKPGQVARIDGMAYVNG